MNKQRVFCKEQRSKSKKQEILCAMFSALCFLLVILIWNGSDLYAQGQSDLKEKVPDLCYRCHVKLKESLTHSSVHFPFKDGKCNACHNSHASNMKGLVKDDINSLCLSCHEGIKRSLQKNYVHNALKRGVCTDCHDAHSSVNKKLLVKIQKDLCWSCHEPVKDELKKSFTHKPFKEGQCSSCHDPHASSAEDLILDAPNTLCRKCHSARCKVAGASIVFAVEKSDCTSCHSGHSSDTRGRLGPYGHKAFLEMKCEECHYPIEAGKKITTKISGKELCLNCHKKGTFKIKDNDVHIDNKKGECIMCHSYHASKRKNLTGKETLLCYSCHENTEKRTIFMEKALKSIRCVPVKDRKCFTCHIPPHSQNPLYLKSDKIQICAQCHTQQHKITHPLGQDVKDPRNGQPVTCVTCHSIHSAKADFMLYFDRKRQLCIQCHKK
jgi:predicted CXXCH cytochrome family protein